MIQTELFKENYGIWDSIIDQDILDKALVRKHIKEERDKCGIECYNCGTIMINKNNQLACLLCGNIYKY